MRDAEDAKKSVKTAPVLKSAAGKQVQAAKQAESGTAGAATAGAGDDGEDDGLQREDSTERKAREEEDALIAEQNQLSRFALGELDITTEDIDFEEVDGMTCNTTSQSMGSFMSYVEY